MEKDVGEFHDSPLWLEEAMPISSSVPQLQKISATSPSSASSRTATRRRALSVFVLTTSFSGFTQQLSLDNSSTSWSKPTGQNFVELPNSGGVKALDLRLGDEAIPVDGDKVLTNFNGIAVWTILRFDLKA
ncbi:peptidyl-prolyl cis-trans isomerase FKBP17-1, chloroplastic-like [Coffea eugenioides]|uniref:peptidyl-prolyl cis-trans isomerase FKBP17-1, chloroplastic-like n=1 Tax=Coffea eugenioides TaxID=49369 RepID=UPI000F5CA677|nr:peptidyl-prolyl cis-trans isomerase FKBP17-1, chloroplastic-like [Coffea arabica]XP_027151900.1 peptidyl-prolyl cis-trans isomerase FKBP17-1, chloroplastic-like [Coffea eugenioides]